MTASRSKGFGTGLAGLSPLGLSRHAGVGRGRVHGSRTLQVTYLLLQSVYLSLLLVRLLTGGNRRRRREGRRGI